MTQLDYDQRDLSKESFTRHCDYRDGLHLEAYRSRNCYWRTRLPRASPNEDLAASEMGFFPLRLRLRLRLLLLLTPLSNVFAIFSYDVVGPPRGSAFVLDGVGD